MSISDLQKIMNASGMDSVEELCAWITQVRNDYPESLRLIHELTEENQKLRARNTILENLR